MASTGNRKVRGPVVIVLSIAVIALCAWAARDWLDPFNDRPFTAAEWARLDAQDRAAMSRDLIKNHLPPGTERGTVEHLLGRPADVLHTTDPGGHSLPGVETYVYYIGTWSIRGFDDTFVYVHFDQGGRVVAAQITGY